MRCGITARPRALCTHISFIQFVFHPSNVYLKPNSIQHESERTNSERFVDVCLQGVPKCHSSRTGIEHAFVALPKSCPSAACGAVVRAVFEQCARAVLDAEPDGAGLADMERLLADCEKAGKPASGGGH